MIYPFSLAHVTIALGLLYLISHGLALWKFQTCRHWLTLFHRNLYLGYFILTLATIWTVGLVATMDLMEYSHLRYLFIAIFIGLAGLTARFLPDFLSVRSLGVLLLLGANVLLDAAFLRDELSRLVITITAYIYVIIGIFLVGMPYLWRDFIAWFYNKEPRAKIGLSAGILFGVILLLLGFLVY